MADNGPEDIEGAAEEAGSDAGDKAREILDRIKGDEDPGEDGMLGKAGGAAAGAGAAAGGMFDKAKDAVGDLLDGDDNTDAAPADDDGEGLLGKAGGAIAGAGAAAGGMFDKAKDAVGDLLDGDDTLTAHQPTTMAKAYSERPEAQSPEPEQQPEACSTRPRTPLGTSSTAMMKPTKPPAVQLQA